MPRAWVELATRLFVEGTTQLLVGTRALLGEGWNCPPLNVLIDMTIATTGVSVQQMRGRSLRLDRDDPLKVASNWDIVCVAPDLVRGSADYERFVRKHLNLFAPAEDGQVEAGPSHVHPELGPFGPPPVERFRDLNRELLARAADRDGARERWQIGTPYRGVELPTLLVRSRSRRRHGAAARDQGRTHAASLPAGPDRHRPRRRRRVRRARRRGERPAAAGRPRARARRPGLGRRPARARPSSGSRSCSRWTRPPAR